MPFVKSTCHPAEMHLLFTPFFERYPLRRTEKPIEKLVCEINVFYKYAQYFFRPDSTALR